ncbi:hypothetical protein [Streptomyces sp. MAI_2237]
MNGHQGNGSTATEERASALDVGLRAEAEKMTLAEYKAVVEAGHKLVQEAGGTWLLLHSEFVSDNRETGTEGHLRDMLRGAYGYPASEDNGYDVELNVLLESPGGSLDSAYSSALYLAQYAKTVRVFVPGRAKSASTLVALGANELYLSPFGELGPLDTQISDPRNPASRVSALDCYQSVDYVRSFGIRTLQLVLPELIKQTDGKVAVETLLKTASDYTLGMVQPMLGSVTALHFGGWGRSLKIGEFYARRLLRMHADEVDDKRVDEIASRLVFDYTHHLFPIDHHEARRIHLPVRMMDEVVYDKAVAVIEKCHRKDFIGFLSQEEAKKAKPWYRGIEGEEAAAGAHGRFDDGHALAQTRMSRKSS